MKNVVRPIAMWLGCLLLILPLSVHAEDRGPLPMTHDAPGAEETRIWSGAMGHGFLSGTQTMSLGIGVTHGILVLGGDDQHDLVPLTLAYGVMIGDTVGAHSWYRGNFEVRLEVLLGPQVNSGWDWTFALTPHLRYHFATGTRWIPYVDIGVGVALTEIRSPDLGGAFQFNEQVAAGVNCFLRDDLAVFLEGRFMHISSAGTSEPNEGVNTVGPFLGVNYFF